MIQAFLSRDKSQWTKLFSSLALLTNSQFVPSQLLSSHPASSLYLTVLCESFIKMVILNILWWEIIFCCLFTLPNTIEWWEERERYDSLLLSHPPTTKKSLLANNLQGEACDKVDIVLELCHALNIAEAKYDCSKVQKSIANWFWTATLSLTRFTKMLECPECCSQSSPASSRLSWTSSVTVATISSVSQLTIANKISLRRPDSNICNHKQVQPRLSYIKFISSFLLRCSPWMQ